MKKCTYCGRENEDTSSHCHECGVGFQEDAPSTPGGWDSFSLFPRSAREWTRSLAVPLFVACVVIFLWAFAEGLGHDSVWRYAGPAVAHGLLPVLGMALGLTCLLGTGLHRGFRMLALTVAFLSVLGPLLAPVVAE